MSRSDGVFASPMSSRSRPLRAAALALLLVFPCAVRAADGPAAAVEYSREFLRALKQYVSGDARARADAEKALRRLGKDAVAQLRAWVDETQMALERARALLAQLEHGDGVSPPADDDRLRSFFTRKLDEGWKRLLDGDYKQARRIAEGLEALDRDPSGGESPMMADYRRLIRACERRLLVAEVLQPAVEFRRRVCEFGDKPALLFRLTNFTDRQLVIHAAQGVLGTLEVSVERRFLEGNVAQTEILTFPVKTTDALERLVIPAKRGYEQDMVVPLDVPADRTDRVIRLRAVGKFRPSQWGVGEKNVNETLRLPETECWVVPAGQSRLAEAPLRKLEAAIIVRDIRAFFVAGWLAVWSASGDDELVDSLLRRLVGVLGELDEFGFNVADRLLKEAGGVSVAQETDRAFWQQWLREHLAEARTRRRAAGDAGAHAIERDGGGHRDD
jgi:hypothetical protein